MKFGDQLYQRQRALHTHSDELRSQPGPGRKEINSLLLLRIEFRSSRP